MAVPDFTDVPGVQCVLSGMCKKPYVEDAPAAIRLSPILNTEEVLNKINENEELLTSGIIAFKSHSGEAALNNIVCFS